MTDEMQVMTEEQEKVLWRYEHQATDEHLRTTLSEDEEGR